MPSFEQEANTTYPTEFVNNVSFLEGVLVKGFVPSSSPTKPWELSLDSTAQRYQVTLPDSTVASIAFQSDIPTSQEIDQQIQAAITGIPTAVTEIIEITETTLAGTRPSSGEAWQVGDRAIVKGTSGQQGSIEVDAVTYEVTPGDFFVLTSSGWIYFDIPTELTIPEGTTVVKGVVRLATETEVSNLSGDGVVSASQLGAFDAVLKGYIQTSLSSISQLISNNTSEINALKTRVTTTENDLASLTTTVGANETSISALQTLTSQQGLDLTALKNVEVLVRLNNVLLGDGTSQEYVVSIPNGEYVDCKAYHLVDGFEIPIMNLFPDRTVAGQVTFKSAYAFGASALRLQVLVSKKLMD